MITVPNDKPGRPEKQFTDDERTAIVNYYTISGSLAKVASLFGIARNTFWYRIFGKKNKETGERKGGDPLLIERLWQSRGTAVEKLRMTAFQYALGFYEDKEKQVVSPTGEVVTTKERVHVYANPSFMAMASNYLKAGLTQFEKSDGQADEKSSLEITFEK